MAAGLNHLDRWLSQDTWHTGGKSDRYLFHKCLKKVISENNGYMIQAQDVRDYIISNCANELDVNYLKSEAERYGQIAEDISEYIEDTK